MKIRDGIRTFLAEGTKTHDELTQKFGATVTTPLSQLVAKGELRRTGAYGARVYSLTGAKPKLGKKGQSPRPRARNAARREARQTAIHRALQGRPAPLLESALESLRRQHELTGRAIEALEQCTGLQA